MEPHTVALAHSPLSRSMITLLTTLGSAFLFLIIGEYIGVNLKHKLQDRPLNSTDNALGSLLSAISVLVAVWLGSSILSNIPYVSLQNQIRSSRIITELDRKIPAATNIIADLGHLIDPNVFPNVFIGN